MTSKAACLRIDGIKGGMRDTYFFVLNKPRYSSVDLALTRRRSRILVMKRPQDYFLFRIDRTVLSTT